MSQKSTSHALYCLLLYSYHVMLPIFALLIEQLNKFEEADLRTWPARGVTNGLLPCHLRSVPVIKGNA
jgi:hypothetical protein